MQSIPANIYSVASIRAIDRNAIEQGTSGYTLMKRAGAAAVAAARRRYPDANRWQVVCGAGNNGGDGYVVARLAALDGIVVSVLSMVDVASLSGDAAKAYGDFAADGGVVALWAGELDSQADLLVDAVLGSGLERDVDGAFAEVVAAINAHPAKVHAMDIATGIHGDTGAVMGCAVAANLTTTFVGLKPGLFLGAGPRFCGEINFADLEIGDDIRAQFPATHKRIHDRLLAEALPPRQRGAHKGDFGHVLVVGGGPGMPGAARLCAEGALRAGAGRVSVATYPDHAVSITSTCPELMSHGISNHSELAPLLAAADVIAFGPGLGRSEWAQEIARSVAESEKPCVWDADALNWLSESPDQRENRVITPHPGEAAGLLALSSADVQADRTAAVDALANQYGGTAVLKGAGTLISSDSDVPYLCTGGNPGMAAPGMGDVLTGIIAALIAQHLSIADAARVGVELHARAGDLAAKAGERGMMASDLLAALRSVVNP